MNTALLVGNPKPRSTTLEVGGRLAQQLFGGPPGQVIDAIEIGPGLLSGTGEEVKHALDVLVAADVLLIGSPTYKSSFSGVLKLLLDQIPPRGLAESVAFPFMVGAAPHHAMAADVFLKPVLIELGAVCPTRGLFIDQSTHNEQIPETDEWLSSSRRFVST